MSVKIEVAGGFLKVTNSDNSVDRFIRAITNYSFSRDNSRLLLREPQGTNQVTHKYKVDDLVDSQGNEFYSFEDLDSFLEENLGSFSLEGGLNSITTGRVVSDQQVYDIVRSNDGNMIQMDYDGDWAVSLPLLSSMENGFKVVLVHNTNIINRGSIVPNYSDIISGEEVQHVYGRGFLTLEKLNDSWVIVNKSLFSNYRMEGVTKRYDFENESTITLNHNLGYVPLIEVWIDDNQGGYSRASLEIQHDWNDMNSLTIEIGSQESGKIIYL